MSLAFFTIATASFLGRARVLAESVLRQHPGVDFYLLMVDRPQADYAALAAAIGVKLVYLEELALPAPTRFTFRYNAMELCTALKPYGFAWLLRHTDAERLIYLDSDIYVVAPLAPVLQAFEDGAMMVLTPHLTAPLEAGVEPDDRAILVAGAYNLGFVGLARRGDCASFVDWWSRHLEYHARADQGAGSFNDQRWMDLAPALFNGVCILRDTSLNLAYWNRAQRAVAFSDGRWEVDGRPLVFAHFSGTDTREPGQFSRHHRHTRANCGAIGALFDDYVERLHAADDHIWCELPHAWASLADGTPIVEEMRAVFRRLWDSDEGPGRDPFALGVADFNGRSLLVEHFPPVSISHVMYEAWAGDASRRAAHELFTAAGQMNFVRWFCAAAQQQLGLPPELVPTAPAPAPLAPVARRDAAARRLRRWAYSAAHSAYLATPERVRQLIRRHRPLVLRDYVRSRVMPLLLHYQYHEPERSPGLMAGIGRNAARAGGRGAAGVTIVGYLDYATGNGETGRAMARACAAAGIAFDIHGLPMQDRHLHTDQLLERHRAGAVPRDTLLLCLNAESMRHVPPVLRRAAWPGRRRIGTWYWELEEFPAAWMSAFDEIDELWAGSPFVQNSLAAVSPVPVLYMPPPVDFALQRTYARADFGLPESPLLFLFSYDFDSFVARKNPRACIEAFQLAFAPERRDVALVIKMLHARRHPEALRALRELAQGDGRILLLDAGLSRDESYGLISVCDVYLSLHRAEGFGLGMAESMRLGKPVVATAYSGNLAFMREGNACLVDYHLVPVGEGEYPYGAGQHWAEPDIAHAARLMQELAQNAGLRERIGVRAAQYMREHFSAAVAGERIRKRLDLLAARGGAP